MKIQGYTKLEINNKVVFEKKNDITEWVSKALHEGDYGGVMPETWKMPLSQWFSGCLLTTLTNDATLAEGNYCLDSLHEVGGVISGNAITAQASDGDYSGTNTKRGRKANSTGPVANGYKFVWEWNADEGNGDIASVCLTRAKNAEFTTRDSNSELDADDGDFIEIAKAVDLSQFTTDTELRTISIYANLIDYENEILYHIGPTFDDDPYNTNILTIRGYRANTKLLHLDGLNCLPISKTPEVNVSIELDQTLNFIRCSFTWTGDAIYLFYVSAAQEITIYKIDMETWTYTKKIYSFSGESFNIKASGWGGWPMAKDQFPIKVDEDNGTFFAWIIGTDNKIYKLDLSDDQHPIAVKSYTSPLASVNANTPLSSYTLPNGDFIWTAGDGERIIYYHYGKDEMKICKCDFNMDHRAALSINGNKYGTVIATHWQYGIRLCTAYPYVSTVNNLNSLATKNYGDQMRLTYTITEVYPDDE